MGADTDDQQAEERVIEQAIAIAERGHHTKLADDLRALQSELEAPEFLARVEAVSLCGVTCFTTFGVRVCKLSQTGNCTCRRAVRAIAAVDAH